MKDTSLLFVQKQRDLRGGACVLSGPSYGGTKFHWTSSDRCEAMLLDPSEPDVPISLRLNPANPNLLTSSEFFGYDPFSTEYPMLRELQCYTSTVVASPSSHRTLLEYVLLSSNATRYRSVRCRMQLSLQGWEQYVTRLAQELPHVVSDEHFVLRWENEFSDGFLLFRAECLAAGLSTVCDVTLLQPLNDAKFTFARLFYTSVCRREKTHKTDYSELQVGDCLLLDLIN